MRETNTQNSRAGARLTQRLALERGSSLTSPTVTAELGMNITLKTSVQEKCISPSLQNARKGKIGGFQHKQSFHRDHL